MTSKLLPALLLLTACLTEQDPELGEADQALTPAVAPIGTFEIRADRIVYVGHDAIGYRAYELDQNLALLRQSPAIAQAPAVENLATDGTYVLFGDGSRNVRLSLAGTAAQTFDPLGVFDKSLHGAGGVTLSDGTLTRVINGNGFGVSALSPIEVFSGAQTAAAPVLSDGARAYLTPASNSLRLVDVDGHTATLICKAPTPYATSKSLATDPAQPSGSVRVAAKLADGRLADCTRNALGTTLKVIDLPFDVGDVSFEGGGGIGIWVASASTPELAYIYPSGKIVIHTMTEKLGITPIPIPYVVRSFSDGSALALMSNNQFVRVAR